MINIDKYANTTATSIPLALCDAYEQRKMDVDDYIILTAFGAGFTWGSCLMSKVMSEIALVFFQDKGSQYMGMCS